MPNVSVTRVKTWLAVQPPGRRLGLFLGAIVAGLGGLSLILPSPPLIPAAKQETKQETKPAAVAAVTAAKHGGAVEIGAVATEKPGADGRAVKTVTVPRPDAKPPADSVASPQATSEPTKAAGALATATADAARASKAWRVGQAEPNSAATAPIVAPSPPSSQTAPVSPPSPQSSASKPATDPSATTGPSATVTAITTVEAAKSAAPAAAFKASETTMKIQDVKSPGGISAWLVEEHSVPLLALRFVFDGGNSQDPAGREGLANFLTAMMDEGAGDMNAAQFQERMEELALRMSFEDARDALYGNFETLTANREPALEMLRLAINKPRFDADAVERIRQQLLANIAYAAKNPQQVAGNTWTATAFAGHPYGRPASGTVESVGAIKSADLEAFRKRNFARDTLRVVAVGDIDAKTLGALLDKVFGEIALKAELVPVAAVVPKAAEKLTVVDMDVPQSVVQFGMTGLPRKDPDFMAAFVMNHILGGGGFSSRLTEQVREKRGLAYSVYSYLQPYKQSALFAGGVATKNESVKESIEVIRAELMRMAKDGPTAEELAGAKSNLTGSFALRFDTNAKIASQLLWMLHEEMGIAYPKQRNALVDAVTMEDIKRAASRILKDEDLLVTVVGRPFIVGVARHRRDRRDILIGVRCRRRARDVGDRRDVIPVEAVPEAEDDHPREQSEHSEVHTWWRAYRN